MNGHEKLMVHITYGLPGSGKTWWSSEQKVDRYIGLNDCMHNWGLTMSRISGVIHTQDMDSVIIDGPVTTHSCLAGIMETVIKAAKDKVSGKRRITFIIHVWNKDVETCIYNDRISRTSNSSASIPVAGFVYEKITGIHDIWKLIGDYVPGTEFSAYIKRHSVVPKPAYKKWFEEVLGWSMDEWCCPGEKLFRKENDVIRSDRWCLGESGKDNIVDLENLVEFSELYNLLLTIDKNIPWRIVKNVESHVNVIKQKEGCADYVYYEIKCEDIYNEIIAWMEEKKKETCFPSSKKAESSGVSTKMMPV